MSSQLNLPFSGVLVKVK